MPNVELINFEGALEKNSEEKIDKSTHVSSNIDSLINNSRILLTNNKTDLAMRLITQILEVEKNNELALELLADIYIKKENYEFAEKCYLRILKIQDNSVIQLKLANLLYKQEKDSLALENYYKALEGITYETHLLFDIYKSIGNIYVKEGDYESAYENYNKAYTLNPNSDVLLVNYGTLEIQKNRFEKAKELFQKALNLNLENHKAWLGLALVHRHFGDLNLSWSNLLRSLDVNFENKTAIQLLMTWGTADSRKDELIGVFESRILKHKGDINSYINLALICSNYRMYKNANGLLNNVLLMDPENEEAMNLLQKINTDRN